MEIKIYGINKSDKRLIGIRRLLSAFSFYLLLFIFCLLPLVSHSQTTPVYTSLQLIPPYSLNLSDYTVPSENRLLLTILLTDQSITRQDIRLKIKIEGNGITIQTKPGFIPPSITLFTNTPEVLSGNDLAAYFSFNNLDFQGIDMEKFRKTGQLPEGLYRFSVEAYDYNRPVLISNKSTSSAWLVLNDPPRWNLPMDNSKVMATNPQNFLMQWLPMHTGSPNAAFNTEYEVTIVELWNTNGNPFDAIRTQTPIYKETLSQTSLQFGPAEPALIPGKKYAAVVRAIAGNGLDLFKNNGYSAVLTFSFGEECLPVQHLTVTSSGIASGLATWSLRPGNTSFRVQYRPLGGANWYGGEEETVISRYTIPNLSPGASYEVGVQAICGTFENPVPVISRFTMPLQPQGAASCTPSTAASIANQTPVTTLKVGDLVKASNQQLRITALTSKGEAYNGKGEWQLAWLGNVPLQAGFSNMRVNSDGVAYSGRLWIEGSAGSVKSWATQQVIDKVPGLNEIMAEADKLITEGEEIISHYLLPSAIKSELEEGIASVKKGKEMVLAGNVAAGAAEITEGVKKLNVAATKAINEIKGQLKNNLDSLRNKKSIASLQGLTVSFKNGANSVYGFDEKTKEELANKYDRETDQTTKGDVYIPWKALEAYKNEVFTAKLTADGSVNPDSVRFELESGTVLPRSPSLTVGEAELNVSGGGDGTDNAVYAVYPTAAGGQNVAKLNLVSYQKVMEKVVLVPLPGTTINADAVKTELNKIYGQAVAGFEVELKATFTLPAHWDENEDGKIEVGSSGLLSNYPKDMREIISGYKEVSTDYTNDHYYLFIGGTPSDNTIQGYMPRAKNFGFIFTPLSTGEGPGVGLKTIAHELGHGAFHLEHTFTETSVTRGSSDNLMDYSTGTYLNKYQWDKVHHPELVIGLFEGDSAGASKSLFNSKFIYFQDDFKDKTAVTNVLGGKDEITQPGITVADNQLVAVNTADINTIIYMAYHYFDAANINDIEGNINSRIDLEKSRLASQKGISNANILIVVNARYDPAITAGNRTVSFKEYFYPMRGLDPNCTDKVNQYIASSARKKFVDGMDAALKERAEKLKEYLENCKLIVSILTPGYGNGNIDKALEYMQMLVTPSITYKYGGGDSRTTIDDKGLEELDCSEFVGRYLNSLGVFDPIRSITTSDFLDPETANETFKDKLEFVKGSDEADFKDIRPGDFFVWDGHMGLVKSYDKTTDIVTVLEAIGNGTDGVCSNEQSSLNASRGCGKTVESKYTRDGKALSGHTDKNKISNWIGYFRPIVN